MAILNTMFSSQGVSTSSAGSTTTLYIDKDDDNYGIGENLTFFSTAEDNIAIGENALNSTTGAALKNIAIGTDALTANTGADNNIAIGYNSMSSLTTLADDNVAVGNYSMDGFSSAAVVNCVSVGRSTLRGSLDSTASGTVAIGYAALTALTSGAGNVAVGYQAGLGLVDEGNNVMIGYQAGISAVNDTSTPDSGGTLSNSVFIGYKAGYTPTGSTNICIGSNTMVDIDSNTTVSRSGQNIFIGYNSGSGTWTGAAQEGIVALGHYTMTGALSAGVGATVAIGNYALNALTTGAGNVAIGYQALDAEVDGDFSTAVGHQALSGQTGTDGMAGNTAIGYNAGITITTGTGNTILGTYAGDGFDEEDDNTLIGGGAGGGGLSASHLVVVGSGALAGAATQDGTVAIGRSALAALTTGAGNVAVGYQAMVDLVEGSNNIAIGHGAFSGTLDITADASIENIFIGTDAGSGAWVTAVSNYNVGIGNTSMSAAMNGALQNTAVGYSSLGNLTTGDNNVAVGCQSLLALETGERNVAMGHNALVAAVGDGHCVAIGFNALGSATLAAPTATLNTAVGYYAGYTITTGKNNTFLGANADADTNSDSYHVRLGHYGGVKFFTARVTLDNSYVGTPAAGHAAHSNALFVIPAYSYISRIYATVVTAGAGTHNYTIEFDDTLDVASGSAVGGTEILGASASTSHWVGRSYDTQDAATDIAASSGVGQRTWISINKQEVDEGTSDVDGWVDADVGIYIVHAGSNTADDPGADPVIQLTVEYTGV